MHGYCACPHRGRETRLLSLLLTQVAQRAQRCAHTQNAECACRAYIHPPASATFAPEADHSLQLMLPCLCGDCRCRHVRSTRLWRQAAAHCWCCGCCYCFFCRPTADCTSQPKQCRSRATHYREQRHGCCHAPKAQNHCQHEGSGKQQQQREQ